MIFYWVIGVLGFLILAMSFVIVDIADVIGFDDDSSWINSRMIAIFATAFGATGIIAVDRDLDPFVALGPSLISGLLMAILMAAVSKWLYAHQGSSSFDPQLLSGQSAQVFTRIPADSIGEISLVVNGTQQRFMARSENNEEVIEGTKVTITSVMGNIMNVSQ